MLLTGGYHQDAKLYYCSSASNMPGDSAPSPSLPRDWMDAGGFDANTLSFGNWVNSQHSTEMLPIYSSYNYRDMSLGVYYPWHRYLETQKDPVTRLSGVSPGLYANIGAPLFKTSRTLAGRAIVSDTFSKGTDKDATGKTKANVAPAETARYAGFGLLAHRDGYNVLYGDWSAKWVGDPQQRILWAKEGRGPWSMEPDMNKGGKIAFNVFMAQSGGTLLGPFDCAIGDDRTANTAISIWHELDNAAGVDVGVDGT